MASLLLAGVWLVTAAGVEVGFRESLADSAAELGSAAREVIHQPALETPARLLPVVQKLMPGFESNDAFSFLRKKNGEDGGAQRQFEERVAAALARFDEHPTRVFGLVPAQQPSVEAFFSHALLHAGLLQGLLTVLIFLLLAPPLERLWGGWRFAPAVTAMALGGAGVHVLVHPDADRVLVGGGAIMAGLAAALLVRFRSEKVDFLAWLPPAVSGELRVPAWALGGVWGVYELAAGLPLPISVPGLAPAEGFVAHAGGALVGALFAVGLERLGWETAQPVLTRKQATTSQFNLGRVEAMVKAGRGDEALDILEAAVSRNPRHRDAVTLFFRMCLDRGQPERAGLALSQLVREELRRGAKDVAVACWRDLVTHVPGARVDPSSLVEIASILRSEGDDELAAVASQQAADGQRLAAASVADGARRELEPLLDPAAAEELKDEDVPVKSMGKELPPNAFYAEQDRSEFGRVDDLSLVEDFPSGAITEAVPRALDVEGLVLISDGRGELRVDYTRVRAISVVGVKGLGQKPVLLIDVLVDGAGTERPLALFRLRSDRFDPRSLVPGSSQALEALRAVVDQILAGSEALPLPDAKSVVMRPPKLYDSLESYEQAVLTPAGKRLS